METPCIKICTYDPAIRMCSGCGRTLDEVRGWFAMTDDERRAVMLELPDRLRAAKPAS